MRIQHHSSGVASVNFVDNGRVYVAIHSADPEPAHESQSIADSNSWTNGDIPVK